jgi:hypothetical protein
LFKRATLSSHIIETNQKNVYAIEYVVENRGEGVAKIFVESLGRLRLSGKIARGAPLFWVILHFN